jgi:hypothetical protein
MDPSYSDKIFNCICQTFFGNMGDNVGAFLVAEFLPLFVKKRATVKKYIYLSENLSLRRYLQYNDVKS